MLVFQIKGLYLQQKTTTTNCKTQTTKERDNKMRTYNDKDFEKTNKKATVTFNGWDGKSYNGEAVNRAIYTNRNLPGKKFVIGYFKNSRCYHEITEETHPVTGANLLSFYTYFDPVEC